MNDYYYSLIDAKVLTSEEITLYLKKQGIHLSRDESGPRYTDINVWDDIMENVSDFKEIYSNAKYNPSSNQIEYKFPVDKIENAGYTLYHNAWIINKGTGTTTLKVILKYTDNSLEEIYSNNLGERNLFQMEITCESENVNSVVTYINKLTVTKPSTTTSKTLNGKISSIIFEFTDLGYSPVIAMHWTYLKMKVTLSNFSFKGNSLCDKNTNPCVNGYYCLGGVCKKCHPSCYDCVNGGLSTDCYSKCNTHAVSLSPEKGSCKIGYVDLNQFEDFKIENIVPPPRNNRLTISFWMFVSSFPESETTAFLNNTFSDKYRIYIFD